MSIGWIDSKVLLALPRLVRITPHVELGSKPQNNKTPLPLRLGSLSAQHIAQELQKTLRAWNLGTKLRVKVELYEAKGNYAKLLQKEAM